MRVSTLVVTVLLFAGATAGSVLSQEAAGMRAPSDMLSLLREKPVQVELRLTAAQVKQINGLDDHVRSILATRSRREVQDRAAQGKKGYDLWRPMTKDEARGRWNKEMAEALRQVTLRPNQLTRLRQIHLQKLGAAAFAETSTQTVLNLTPEQASAVQELLGKNSSGEDDGTLARLVDLLTDEQKAAWKAMLGSPFGRTVSTADTRSDKSPDAAEPDQKEQDAERKLQLAKLLAAQGKLDKAQERYAEIDRLYPETKAAEEARDLLNDAK